MEAKALIGDYGKKAFSKQIMTGAEKNTVPLAHQRAWLGKWHLARELTPNKFHTALRY